MVHFKHTLFACLILSGIFFLACGSSSEPASKTANAQTGAKLKPEGMVIFRKYCVACHGADGKLGMNGAKDLTQSLLTVEEKVTVITNGRKVMTPFAEVLTPEEIKAVAEYTVELKK